MAELNPVFAISNSVNKVSAFTSGLQGRELFFSYGEVVPNILDPSRTVLWMGGLHAYRMQQLGFGQHLTSPGAAWLPKLPEEFLKRTIMQCALKNVPEYGGSVWLKLSEAKVDALAPGLFTYEQQQTVRAEAGLSEDVSVQYTTTFLNLDWEHRFFVVDRELLTGSPYAVGGMGYRPHISWSRYEEALQFVTAFVDSGVPLPPSITVDVGYDADSENWVVIEANRPWSSGIYGADPTLFLVAAEVSQEAAAGWGWEPDSHIVQEVEKIGPLRLESYDPGDYRSVVKFELTTER